MFMLHLCNGYKDVLPCLPRAPDWSDKRLKGQQLGSRGVGGAGRQNRQQEESKLRKGKKERTRERGRCLGLAVRQLPATQPQSRT